MSFDHPAVLWCLPLVPVLWALAYLDRARHLRRRLLGATVLRSVVLVLVVIAAAGPQWLERVRGISVVYVLDVSRSVAPGHLKRTVEWIRTAQAQHRPAQARHVVFADRARVVDSVDDIGAIAVSPEERSRSKAALGQGSTDVEAALRAATYAFAPGLERRLVLVSDGRQTHGDLWRVLPRLQEEGIRVFAMPAPAAVASDAWIDTVEVPLAPRVHEPVTVQVNVHASHAARAKLQLSVPGRRVDAMSVELQPGRNRFGFDVRFPAPGEQTVSAAVRADGDAFADNDRASAGVTVRPAPRVLYVEGATERAHFLADALRAHHIEVASMGPEPFVQDPQALRGFDALILSNLLVQNIDARTAAAIEAFVRDDGGGLVFSSGDSTYGHEGFAGSAMERLLPVRFEGKRKKSEVDLVLLIDRSHSMRGRKLELAKTAALSTLDLLEPRHRLAVVAFDSKPHEVVPLAPVGTRRRAEDLIASMTAKGQTSLYPALAEARRLLANSTAQIKHVILMSDGITAQPPSTASTSDDGQAILAEIIKGRAEALRRDGIAVVVPDAPEPPPAPGAIEAVVAELAAAGVTVSTVVVGDKPNLALMRDIAILGHGRTQVARADAEIPGLFVKEARQLLGESMIEEPFRPTVSHPATVLEGVDFTKGPPLRGIVVARPKRFADVLLQGPKAGPLLATTHYGLGRSVAFLSDVNNRWSADWVGWDGYARLWAQVVRHVARVPSQMLAFEVHRSGTEAVLSLRAETREGFHRNGLAPVARMTSPDGESASVPLRPVSPGTYAARRPVASGSARPYRFELLGSGGLTGEEVRRVGTRTLFHPWPDEDRTQAADVGTLQALAERTGGAVSASTAEIFRRHGDGSAIRRALWPVLVAAALVMFLLDVYWRRAGGRRRETVPGRGEAASR